MEINVPEIALLLKKMYECSPEPWLFDLATEIHILYQDLRKDINNNKNIFCYSDYCERLAYHYYNLAFCFYHFYHEHKLDLYGVQINLKQCLKYAELANNSIEKVVVQANKVLNEVNQLKQKFYELDCTNNTLNYIKRSLALGELSDVLLSVIQLCDPNTKQQILNIVSNMKLVRVINELEDAVTKKLSETFVISQYCSLLGEAYFHVPLNLLSIEYEKIYRSLLKTVLTKTIISSDAKESIKKCIENEIENYASSLEDVEAIIEESMQISLGNIDKTYIQRKYIKTSLQVCLKHVESYLADVVKNKDNKTLEEIFTSLDDVNTILNIPYPVNLLKSCKQLVKYHKYVTTNDDKIFIKSFKEMCFEHVITYCSSASKEINFLENIVIFLESCNDLQLVIVTLEIESFCKGNLPFDHFLINILQLDHNLYGDQVLLLQESAKTIQNEEYIFLLDKFRTVLHSCIKPVEINLKYIDGRHVIEINGTNVVISEVLFKIEDKVSEVDEMRFIASGKILIDTELSREIYHGKNIVIATKKVIVSRDIVWDVSGLDKLNVYTKNAGMSCEGHGNNGDDGLAGESGGNVYIIASEIISTGQWTIKSNGGNGSNGQDGGNGRNGENGKGMTHNEFKLNLPPVAKFDRENRPLLYRKSINYITSVVKSIKTQWLVQNEMSNKIRGNVLDYIKANYKDDTKLLGMSFYLHVLTKDDKEIIFSNTHHQNHTFSSTHCQAYVLVKGSLGTAGGRGGENGLGGEGGHPGEVDIQHIDGENHLFNVNNIVTKGKDGQNGKKGSHGDHGVNGWDIAYLDYKVSNFFTSKWPKYFGTNENSKLGFSYERQSNSSNVYCQYNSCIEETDMYVSITSAHIERNKRSTYDDNERTRQNRDRKHQAKASMKKAIAQDSICDLYVNQIRSDKKSVLQSIHSDIENVRTRALQALAKTKDVERIQTTKEQRHTRLTTFTPDDQDINHIKFMDCTTNFNEPTSPLDISNCTVDNFLNSWQLIKNFSVLTEQDFRKIYLLFNKVKSQIDPSMLVSIENIFISKFQLLALHLVNLQTLDIDTEHKPMITARNIEKYLLRSKNPEINLKHSALGKIDKYIYSTNIGSRKDVLNLFRDKVKTSEFSTCLVETLQTFFIELEENENTPTFAKQVFDRYKKFTLSSVEIIDEISKTYKNEKTSYNEIYQTLSRYNFCRDLCQNNKELTEEWFQSFVEKSKLNTFDYVLVFQNDRFVESFVQFINEDDTYIQTYLALLAYIYETNIRLFLEYDDANAFAFLVEFNCFADNKLHFLISEQKLSLLEMNQQYYNLQFERSERSKTYLKVLSYIDGVEIIDFSKTQNIQSLITAESFTFIAKPPSFYDEIYIEQISNCFSGAEKQKIKSQLGSIKSSIIGKNYILYYISKRFNCEGRHVPLQALSFMVNIVLDSYLKNQDISVLVAWTIAACPQSEWTYKLFIIHLESYFKINLHMNTDLQNYSLNIKNPNIFLLIYFNLLSKVEIGLEKFMEVLRLLSLVDTDVNILQDFFISEWIYVLKENYWIQKLVSNTSLPNQENLFTISYYLLAIENIYGEKVVNDLVDTLGSKLPRICDKDILSVVQKIYNEEWYLSGEIIERLSISSLQSWLNSHNPQSNVERKVSEITGIIKNDNNTSQNIINNITKIDNLLSVSVFRRGLNYISTDPVSEYTEEDVSKWAKKYRVDLKISKNKTDFILSKHQEVMSVVNRAIYLKKKFYLRDTQKVSILLLVTNNCNTLAQVSTGEGKSLIVVAVAIMKAICGEKVDIITSSSVLAKRDSKINLEIYSLFQINVSHNCSEKVDERKKAYSNHEVIYGELSNFQRDYLLHEFYGKNVLGDRDFGNVIVDEVDSMLLDKGNNVLYLSHDIANLDKLESVFTFIWQWVNKPTENVAELQQSFDTGKIKDAIMLELFCQLKKVDFKNLNSNLKDSDCSIIFDTLVKYKILDQTGKLLVSKITDLTLFQELSSKIADKDTINKDRLNFFLSEFHERTKYTCVPNFLKPFVEAHIECWSESALTALFMQERVHYIVDVDRSGTSADLNPNITIIDKHTGTDQANSQWDEALHQFLQLKHGCKVSLMSLKAVFISNVSYFKMYKHLYGLTGTLGSEIERELLKSVHKVDFVTIPTAKSKLFQENRPILCNNLIDWFKEIEVVTLDIIKTRSVLIICESVKEVECLGTILTKVIPDGVHTYSRDYEEFEIAQGDEVLEVGHVIIATNLAGRGTDIKITKKLRQAGGLHVIISFLPENKRIEQQAFGRAARCGDEGSGQLIVMTSNTVACSSSKLIALKRERDINEIKKISLIKSHYENQILIEENCFSKFKDAFQNIKYKMTSNKINEKLMKIILQNILDNWAFWLDKNSKSISKLEDYQTKTDFENSLNEFILEVNNLDYQSPQRIIKATDNPLFIINLAKHFCEVKQYSVANTLLNELFLHEPDVTSETAHYYKAYALSKIINWEDSPRSSQYYKPFKSELRKASEGFKKLQDTCMNSSGIIETMKHKNKECILQIEAYEDQQKSISNMYNIFIQSIEDIFGHTIQQNSFVNAAINDQLSEMVYKDLIDEGILKQAHVTRKYCTPSLKTLIHEYGLSDQNLLSVIEQFKGKQINCKVFLKTLTQNVEISSRESFWKMLTRENIIEQNKVIKYIIINEDLLKNIDPSLLNLFKNNSNMRTECFVSNSNTLFLYPELIKNNENSLMYKKDDIKNVLTREHKSYSSLKEKGVFSYNKEAKIDDCAFNVKYLPLFDVITKNNFTKENICDNESEKILKTLIELKILKLDENCKENYRLVGTSEIIEEMELKDFPLYELSVKTLLRHHFAYRLALNEIKSQVEKKVDVIKIPLVAKPHKDLFWSLVEKRIIKPVKFDVKESENLETKLKQKYPVNLRKSKLKDIIYSCDLIPCSFKFKSLLPELLTKKWLYMFDNNFVYKINESSKFLPLSDTFKLIEDTLKLILMNHFVLSQDATIQHLVATSNRSQSTLRSLNVPEFSLQPLSEYFNDGNFSNFQELQLFTLNGIDYVIQLYEKKYTAAMIWSTIAVIAMGLCQIVIGVVIELYSVGFMTHVGSAFISEGISDLIYAASALRTGYFSWKDYGKHKLQSLITTAASAGIAGFLSRGAKLSRFGHKIAGPTTKIGGKKVSEMAGKELIKTVRQATFNEVKRSVGKEVAKRIALKSIEGIAVGLANAGVDYVVENHLQGLCNEMATAFISGINETVEDHKISKTLEEAYFILGETTSENLINHFTASFLNKETNFENFVQMSSKISSSVISGIGGASQKLSMSGSGSIGVSVNAISKVLVWAERASHVLKITQVTEKLLDDMNQQLIKSVQEKGKSNISQQPNKNDEKFQQFRCKVIDKWTGALESKVSAIIKQNIASPILKDGANHLVRMLGRGIKSTYRAYKERQYFEQFKTVKQDHKNKLKNVKKDDIETIITLEQEHNKKMMTLLAKTRSPELFGAIIRENVSMNITCVEACTKLISKLTGINIKIKVKSEQGLSEEIICCDNSNDQNVYEIELELKDNHFQLCGETDSTGGSTDKNNNCLFESLSKKVNLSMTAGEFRNKVANIVETDRDIRYEICQGWHQFSISYNAYGGAKITKNQASRFPSAESRKINEELEKLSPVQHPTWKFVVGKDFDLRKPGNLSNKDCNKQLAEGFTVAFGEVDAYLTSIVGKKVIISPDHYVATLADVVWMRSSHGNVIEGQFPTEVTATVYLQQSDHGKYTGISLHEPQDSHSSVKVELTVDLDNPVTKTEGPHGPHVGYDIKGPKKSNIKLVGHVMLNKNENLPDRGRSAAWNNKSPSFPLTRLLSAPNRPNTVLERTGNCSNSVKALIRGKSYPSNDY